MLAVALLIPGRTLLGFGRDGHQIVARIAETRLTPKAKAAVGALLKDKSIVEIASWADEVRKDREETSTWHYVDIPYEMKGYDALRDGKDGNNIIDKLNELANTVNTRSASDRERAEALKFVVHFMGDLHQPLHCAERNNDKGGNFRLVWFPGEKKASNLHRVWDSSIINRAMKRDKLSAEQYADMLNGKVTKDLERAMLGGDPVRWANEGHDIAVNVTYRGIPTEGAPPTLDEDYLAAAETATNAQLQRAGVRLAALLNRIFN